MSTHLCVVLLSALVAVATGCPGTSDQGYLSGINIHEFKGCSKVEGSLVINHNSLIGDDSAVPPVTVVDFYVLSTINEITGYLAIQNLNSTNITNLRFLHNLEVLGGNETVEFRPGQEYSLMIEDNDYLQTLGLSSLREIRNGGVRVSGNPQLCLVDTLDFEDLLGASTLVRTGGLGTDCAAFTCHDQCSTMKGCWGTLADECVECRNYQFMGTCLQSCDLVVCRDCIITICGESVSYPDDSTSQCISPSTPTAPLLTTVAITASQTQMSTHVYNNITTLSPQASMTVMHSVTTSSPTVDARSFWPFYTLAGSILVFLIVMLSGLAIFGYCWLRLSKYHKKVPLIRPHSSMRADSPSEVNSHHSLNSRDRHRSTPGNQFYSQTENTTPNEEVYTATSDVNFKVNSEPKSSVAHQWHPDGFTSSGNEFVKSSPTLSKRSVSQQSEQSCSSGSPQLLNFRQSQNSILPPTMPGGVYNTRTPPSHPQKSSHHTDTPHTHRGSTSSFQGGRNSRASGKQSRSRSSNSWSSNKAEIRFPGPMNNPNNSFQEDCELTQ